MFNKIVSFFSSSQQVIIIATSVLIVGMLVALIKKRSIYSFTSIWLYITLGVFQTQMNMSRNAVAIFFCYLAMDFIREKRLASYIIAVAIATMYHKSAILFLPIYWLVNRVHLTPSRIIRIVLLSLVMGIFFSVLRPYLYALLPLRYKRYVVGSATSYEGLIVGAFHFAIIAYLYCRSEREKRPEILEKATIGTWMFTAEMLFFCLGFGASYSTRVAALFGPYIIIFVPEILEYGMRSEKKRVSIAGFLCLISGVQYILRLSINNIGSTMPYHFFR